MISADLLRSALCAACDRMEEERDRLGALDAAAGDGDLGATLAAGFTHVRAALAELEGADAGALLSKTGRELALNAPSTIGTLLGTAFMRAGAEVEDVRELGSSHISALLAAALTGVEERGGARPGQRTIVDALDGSARSAAGAEAEGLGARDVLSRAAHGAATAAAATVNMEPRHGRAAWVGARAHGHEDAGAAAWATLLAAIAETTATTLERTGTA